MYQAWISALQRGIGAAFQENFSNSSEGTGQSADLEQTSSASGLAADSSPAAKRGLANSNQIISSGNRSAPAKPRRMRYFTFSSLRIYSPNGQIFKITLNVLIL